MSHSAEDLQLDPHTELGTLSPSSSLRWIGSMEWRLRSPIMSMGSAWSCGR